MLPSARLLLIGSMDGWCERLSLELDRLGWTTVTACDVDAALLCVRQLQIEAVLIDQKIKNETKDLLTLLRTSCRPRLLPVIIISDEALSANSNDVDLVFRADAHAQQIALRLEQIIRANVADEELTLRCMTFADHGLPMPNISYDTSPMSILSVGNPSPGYLALNHAMSLVNAKVYAAFSSYSAFDFLHDRNFDAVILWGGDTPSEAMAIASGMRRNSRLYHTPILLRLQNDIELDLGEAYLRGINDIAMPDAKDVDIAMRMMQLASTYRHQFCVRNALETLRTHEKIDTETGLFSLDLFASHLGSLVKASVERNRPLSVCVLKINETDEIKQARSRKNLIRAMPQIGSMISRLVRAEDTAGRLSSEIFALALPATNLISARQVGERIAAVIGCTAFDSGTGRPPFVVEFDIGVAQLTDDESATDALKRAADSIYMSDSLAV